MFRPEQPKSGALSADTPFENYDDDTDTESENEPEAALDVPLELARRRALLGESPVEEARLSATFAAGKAQLAASCDQPGLLSVCFALADAEHGRCLTMLREQTAWQTELLQGAAADPATAEAALRASPMEASLVPASMEVSRGDPVPLLLRVPKVSAVMTRFLGRGRRKFGEFGRFIVCARGVDGRVLAIRRSHVSVTGGIETCSVTCLPSGAVEVTYVPGPLATVCLCVTLYGVVVLRHTAARCARSASTTRQALWGCLQARFPPGSLLAELGGGCLALALSPVLFSEMSRVACLATAAMKAHPTDAAVAALALAMLKRCAQHGLFATTAKLPLDDAMGAIVRATSKGLVLTPEASADAFDFVMALARTHTNHVAAARRTAMRQLLILLGDACPSPDLRERYVASLSTL